MFNLSAPIDEEMALQTLCGSEQMFYMMLNKFEGMTFLEGMNRLAEAIDDMRFFDPLNS